jgi:hypothetical protein
MYVDVRSRTVDRIDRLTILLRRRKECRLGIIKRHFVRLPEENLLQRLSERLFVDGLF